MKILRRPDRREAAPTPVDQHEQRRRRRTRLEVVYGGEFDLAAEVRDITAPLAERVAAEPSPLAHRDQVDDLVGAVGAVARSAALMLARREARFRARAVPAANRGRAIEAFMTLVDRPADPDPVTDDDLTTGRWSEAAVAHVAEFSDQLAAYLGDAMPPGSTGNLPSVSTQVEDALRMIDLEAIDLERRLDRAAAHRVEFGTHRETPKTTRRRRAAETLTELGLSDERISQ